MDTTIGCMYERNPGGWDLVTYCGSTMRVGSPRNGNEERKWYGTTRITTRGIRRIQYFDTLTDEELKYTCQEKAPNVRATPESM